MFFHKHQIESYRRPGAKGSKPFISQCFGPQKTSLLAARTSFLGLEILWPAMSCWTFHQLPTAGASCATTRRGGPGRAWSVWEMLAWIGWMVATHLDFQFLWADYIPQKRVELWGHQESSKMRIGQLVRSDKETMRNNRSVYRLLTSLHHTQYPVLHSIR